MNEIATYSNNVTKLTTEIKVIQDNVCQGMIEIGKRLIEIKKELGHGQWLPYVKNELGYSSRTANNLMKVAKEFAEFEIESIKSLSSTKIIALLDLEYDQIDIFLRNTNAEELTTREFKEEVKKFKFNSSKNEINNCKLKTAMKNNTKKPIPSITLKSLSVRSNGKCEICGWGNEYMVGVLHPHHIIEYHKTQDNSIDNLVMVCPNCHNIIHTIIGCSDDAIKSGILSSLEENTYSKILKYIS